MKNDFGQKIGAPTILNEHPSTNSKINWSSKNKAAYNKAFKAMAFSHALILSLGENKL